MSFFTTIVTNHFNRNVLSILPSDIDIFPIRFFKKNPLSPGLIETIVGDLESFTSW